MLCWNRLWKSFKINLIISPHHISDNCDPPLNAAMAIRIRVGVGRGLHGMSRCHIAQCFFPSFAQNIWYIIYHRHRSVWPSSNKLKQPLRAELYTIDFKIDSQLLVFENHAAGGFENWFQVFWQMFSGDLLRVQLCAMCNLTTSTKRTIYIFADQQEEDTDRDKYKTVLDGWCVSWIVFIASWQRCCV